MAQYEETFYFDKYGRLDYGQNDIQEAPKQGNLLFVFGTLRFHNKHLLKDSKLYRSNVFAPGNFYLMIYKESLPVMVDFIHSYNDGRVMGDIYQVSDEVLKEIDAFKHKTSNLYRRKKITIGNYGEISCFAYVYPVANPSPVNRKDLTSPERINGDYGKFLDSLINEEELLND